MSPGQVRALSRNGIFLNIVHEPRRPGPAQFLRLSLSVTNDDQDRTTTVVVTRHLDGSSTAVDSFTLTPGASKTLLVEGVFAIARLSTNSQALLRVHWDGGSESFGFFTNPPVPMTGSIRTDVAPYQYPYRNAYLDNSSSSDSSDSSNSSSSSS